MESFAYFTVVVFLFNLAPAFAPPTWTVLVFFALNSHLQPWLIVIFGAIFAGLGRYNLARFSRILSKRLNGKALVNLQSVRAALEEKSTRKYAMLAFFVISPLPSAQLFEAAGLIGARLLPLTIAFFSGRLIIYSFYVAGASQLKAKGIGSLITEQFTSIWAILIQLAMIGAILLLPKLNWTHLRNRK